MSGDLHGVNGHFWCGSYVQPGMMGQHIKHHVYPEKPRDTIECLPGPVFVDLLCVRAI